jgi:molybdopterin-guanine dinucleotide biosynthesis protein A
MQAAGFVLVGGQSSRMGRDKARLQYNFHLLVEDVARRVENVAGQVALIGDPPRYSDLNFDIFPDLRPSAGPLGGIEAALASKRGELNLITGCDMPGLDTNWLRTLLLHARTSTAKCILTRDRSGKLHPLCAVYRAACLPVVQRALDGARLKLLDVVAELEPDILDSDVDLVNINTPEDWSRWLRNGTNQVLEATTRPA